MNENVGEWLGGAFHSAKLERMDERAERDVLIIARGAKEMRRLRMANAAQAGERRGTYTTERGAVWSNAYAACVAERSAQKERAARNAFGGK
jgi:hypothetical protein